jgi:hypothetical protein
VEPLVVAGFPVAGIAVAGILVARIVVSFGYVLVPDLGAICGIAFKALAVAFNGDLHL